VNDDRCSDHHVDDHLLSRLRDPTLATCQLGEVMPTVAVQGM